jgi:hypothetical protein
MEVLASLPYAVTIRDVIILVKSYNAYLCIYNHIYAFFYILMRIFFQ